MTERTMSLLVVRPLLTRITAALGLLPFAIILGALGIWSPAPLSVALPTLSALFYLEGLRRALRISFSINERGIIVQNLASRRESGWDEIARIRAKNMFRIWQGWNIFEPTLQIVLLNGKTFFVEATANIDDHLKASMLRLLSERSVGQPFVVEATLQNFERA